MKEWQQLLLEKTELVTERGKPLKVIYPGRANDDRGADFRDAVIALNGGLIRGDIEVHVKSSDWRAHRHHQDPVYNQVILHVVMWHNARSATTIQNGQNVHILALHKYIKQISQRLNKTEPTVSLNTPCLKASTNLRSDIITEFLDNAGEQRFLAKAARLEGDLAKVEASQLLYREIMGALGYSKNKLPFLELAHRLPLRALESITQSAMSDEECLARQQALLLGTAGLLPSQRRNWHRGNKLGDKWMGKLEALWTSLPHRKVMPPNTWHLFKVRPSNSPVRRLAAMSYLTLRYREKGIFEELVNIIREVPINKCHHRLEKGVMVGTDNY